MKITSFLRLPTIISALPNNIQNGQTADAVPLMADLNHIVNQVNANAVEAGTVALLAAANTFTLVQSGVAATNAANFPIASQVQNRSFNTLASTLGTDTITARVAAMAPSAYAAGQIFTFIPSQTNTGAATLNVNGLGAKNIVKLGALGSYVSLSSTDLLAGAGAAVLYDDANATQMVLLNAPKRSAIIGPVSLSSTFVEIPAPIWAKKLTVSMDAASAGASWRMRAELGSAGGYLPSSAYEGTVGRIEDGSSSSYASGGGFVLTPGLIAANADISGALVMTSMGGDGKWSAISNVAGTGYTSVGAGRANSGIRPTRIRVALGVGAAFDSGNASLLAEE